MKDVNKKREWTTFVTKYSHLFDTSYLIDNLDNNTVIKDNESENNQTMIETSKIIKRTKKPNKKNNDEKSFDTKKVRVVKNVL